MTNKLPIVGRAEIQSLKDAIQNNLQRFKKEKSSLPIWVIVLINQLQNEIKTKTQSHSETKTRICPVCKIDYSGLDLSHYCSPDCQIDAERLSEAMKSDQVREAMQKLKNHVLLASRDPNQKYSFLNLAARDLLNALDKQFNN